MQIKRFEQYSLEESLVNDFLSSLNGLINESNDIDDTKQQIIDRFKEVFGETIPSNKDFSNFYQQLRSEGIDDVLISDTLYQYILNPSLRKSKKELPVKNKKELTIAENVLSKLRLDTKLALTFGAGISAMYPIVSKLMQNMNIKSIELTTETVVLLTIAAITIIYIEEKKFKSTEEEEILTKDSKSMLEELRMRSIGDGIVKKLIMSLGSIKSIFSLIGKHIGIVIKSITHLIDMFSYTAILIPIMNVILSMIDKYEMNIDTIVQNLFSLSMGVSTKIVKELIIKLKNKLNIDKEKKVLDEIETPVIQKFSNYIDQDSGQDGELIKEQ